MKILNVTDLQIGDYVARYSDNDYIQLKVVGYTTNRQCEKKLLLYPISVPITHFDTYSSISSIVYSRDNDINCFSVEENIPYSKEVIYLTLDEIYDTYYEMYSVDCVLPLKSPIVGYDPLDNTYLIEDNSGIPMGHLLNPAHLIIAPNTSNSTKVSWTSKLPETSIPLSQTLKEKMESSIAKREDEYTSYALTIVEKYKKEILEKADSLNLYSPTTTIDLSSCPYPLIKLAPIIENLLNEDGSKFKVNVLYPSIDISF